MIRRNLLVVAMVALLPFIPADRVMAAESGDFTFVDNGSTITITGYNFLGPRDVVIPPSINGKPVVALGGYLFRRTRTIISVSIPPSVTSIGPGAFVRCSSLREVRIPDGVTTIGRGAFSQCQQIQEVVLPAGLTELGEGAFGGCDSLSIIRIPKGVIDLNARVFMGCKRLEEVVIPSTLMSIGDNAFAGTALRSIAIPDSVTSVGENAFASCKRLKSFSFPPGLTIISDEMLRDTRSLKRITIPDGVKSIGQSAFLGSGVEELELGSGIKSIGDSAFRSCVNLTTVRIPSGVGKIGNAAFANCRALESAFLTGNAPDVGKKAFGSAAHDFRIFVEPGTRDYTFPKWQGNRSSVALPEISVHGIEDKILVDGQDAGRFKDTLVGMRTSLRYEILNVGPLKLKRLDAVVTGKDSADFKVRNLSKSSLAYGKSAVLEVVFAPVETGRRTATLEITSDDGDESPFEIKLTGTGLEMSR